MSQYLSDRAIRAHAFLFAEGGALSWKRLGHLIDSSIDETRDAVRELSDRLAGSGLSIIETGTEVAMATAPEAQGAIRAAYENQLQRDMGDAGLEVVALLLYRGPSTRAHIDYIRGVNTASTIRTLLSRGLIERQISPGEGREFCYAPTAELLAHLGVGKTEELAEYATIRSELAAFEDSKTPFESYAGGSNDHIGREQA